MSITYGFLIPGGLEKSTEFSEAIHAVAGDGVTKYGGQYDLTLGGSFRVNISTGYVMANGRYIAHDQPFSLTLPASNNNSDRYDAVAAHVDYTARKGEIITLKDIDPENLARNAEEYNCYLYVVHIRRGSSVLRQDDIQDIRGNNDLCGCITPLSEISNGVMHVYNFLNFGIDEAVQRVLGFVQSTMEDADKKIAALEKEIEKAGGYAIGALEICRNAPTPMEQWLLCDGSSVPSAYAELSKLLGGKLPNISKMTDRYRVYIYGGVA